MPAQSSPVSKWLFIQCIIVSKNAFVQYSNFFVTCSISRHGRCHELPCLNEFSGVVVCCFTLSRQTSWTEVLLSWAGRLAQTIVRGNCLFKVMGQQKCDYYNVKGCAWCVCTCVKQSEQSDNKVNRHRFKGSLWRRSLFIHDQGEQALSLKEIHSSSLVLYISSQYNSAVYHSFYTRACAVHRSVYGEMFVQYIAVPMERCLCSTSECP